MEITVKCFRCILDQIVPLAKAATPDEFERRQVIRRMLNNLSDIPEHATPPELAAIFHREVRRVSGINDMYREEKDKSTELGLSLLPELKELVNASNNPFETAVRFAIGGNVIDYGAMPDFKLDTAEKKILEVLELEIDRTAVQKLKKRMDDAESIFYILDNCGEAVLDRLLIKKYKDKITLGVRGEPIFNDVTRREAEMSGLTCCPIVDTGDLAPGVSLNNSCPNFLKQMRKADLVVAKGQGNLESLSGLYDRPIAFLLRIKCDVISKFLNAPLLSLQVKLENM